MRRRSPPERGMPSAAQRCDVEITQARNLDIKGLSVRQCRTDPDPWQLDQATLLTLPLSSLAIR